MLIRKFLPSDYKSAYRLWIKTPGVAVRAYDDSEPEIIKFLERNPSTCFIAEEDGAIVGTILGGNDGRRGYIYHLTVAEGFRKNGIGKLLTDKTIEAFKAAGIAKIALFCLNENEGGNTFWGNLGFEVMNEAVTWAKRVLE